MQHKVNNKNNQILSSLNDQSYTESDEDDDDDDSEDMSEVPTPYGEYRGSKQPAKNTSAIRAVKSRKTHGGVHRLSGVSDLKGKEYFRGY